MQYSDLGKIKVLKIQRNSKSDERKSKFQSVLKSLIPGPINLMQSTD
jgi:hypothetical protein